MITTRFSIIRKNIVRTILFSSLFLFVSPLYSQISVTPSTGKTPEQVVKEVIMGNGVTITNVKFNGTSGKLNKISSSQFGTFTNNEKGFPGFFSSGIILCSGNCKMAEGPNNHKGKTDQSLLGSLFGNSQCKELEKIVSPYSVNHPAVLEFDFSSVSNHVAFRYVFATEEYPKFSCSAYNDVFGFFIKDPKTGQTKNIALIPGTNDAVSVNNIHPDYGISCKAVNEEYLTMLPAGAKAMQFNGYVGPFVAEADLVPNRTYHILLAIANVSDEELESAVFIEALSFNAVDDYGTVVGVDSGKGEKPAEPIVKTKTLPEKTTKGVSFDKLRQTGLLLGLTMDDVGYDTAIDLSNYDISAETAHDWLFDTISATIQGDSLFVYVHPRGKWCNCFFPDKIPATVVLTPKKSAESGSQLERIEIPVVVPVIERGPWLSRCLWVVVTLAALLVFLIYLRALLKKRRFHRGARIKNSYFVEDSPKEVNKNGRPLRKEGFAAWFNRWLNPFVVEQNTISFVRPKTPPLTFTASESKNKVWLSESSFDPKKMSIPNHFPKPKDGKKKSKADPIPISEGLSIEIKSPSGTESLPTGHLKYTVEGTDDTGGYFIFIGLLMFLSVVCMIVLIIAMFRGLA